MAYTTIDDPSAYFQVATWSGNASNQAITNDGNSDLQPDWLWIKARNEASDHALLDSTRGLTKRIHSNTTDQETNDSSATVSSFDSDGFTMTQYNVANDSDDTGVAWQWKANGGTTSSNSDGSITSTVQANTTAGFSIVTYTGTGSNATVGHGLNSAPQIVLLKGRSNSGDWQMYNTNLSGTNKTISINTSDAANTESSPYYSFNNTAPTSTVFSLGSGNTTNGSSRTFVAYCFAEIQGYSKFGSYTGNGNADGTFVYLGFKPAWVMVKLSSGSGEDWHMFDSKRSTSNVVKERLIANGAAAENANDSILDFLSNGFKFRENNAGWNGNNNTYIYMAFAEHPFVSSEGVPTTAR